ncbi:leucine-rich repeat domain-containing protein [Candidatus Uabimicrobium amorphum]|uniref:Disease resistance R13L4/SHOC-2-like LRR domain-containing protein n=1 Tax=Uabimicrobium amorphum TaxID=2596890 RepID=A0A5S9F207_UABAM|nr:leucine-rich repeat domain-containing protein [Candidatus Uabimicrobium amorphum]BBM83165.1 hypothetical protein UABAM_01516 [Candidatus Uabimicrobium amorphum]
MTNFKNQTLQEIKDNCTYENCVLQLYSDIQQLQNSNFHDCQFKNEVVSIYGIANCTFHNCEFEELSIANKIETTQIVDCKIEYLNLEALKISDKTLAFIHPNNSIGKLNLHWTDLKEIPTAVLKIRTLESLYLGNNYITEVPENIVQLYQLHLLDLSDNAIEKLPTNLSQLQSLKVLGLSGNKITQIPGIQNMKQLSDLVLDKANFSAEQQKVICEYLPSCSVYFE